MRVVGCWRTSNSEKWLGYSILSALPCVDEVMVVDGDFAGRASTDRTTEIAEAFAAHAQVHLHQNGPCQGWAGKNQECFELARSMDQVTHLFFADHDEILSAGCQKALPSLIERSLDAVALQRRQFVKTLDWILPELIPHKLSVVKVGAGNSCRTLDGKGYHEHWVNASGENLFESGTLFASDPGVHLDHLREVESPGAMYADLWRRFVRFEDDCWAAAPTDSGIAAELRDHILAHSFFTGNRELVRAYVAPEVFRCRTARPWQTAQLDLCSGAVEHPDPGRITMDARPLKGVDVVQDLTDIPWPFPDEQFDCITLQHGLEHMHWECVPRVLAEAYRVLRLNGSLHVVGSDPHPAAEQAISGQTRPQEAMRRIFGIVDQDWERHQSLLIGDWVIAKLHEAGFAHASRLAPPSEWEIELVAFKADDVPVPSADDPRP
jgi:SAM-dependent methyltransferase